MRTLFMTEGLQYPPTVGIDQRVSHVLRAVAAVSDVTLVSATPPNGEPVRMEGPCALCDEVRLFPYSSLAWSKGWPWPRSEIARRSLFSSLPLYLQYHESSEATALVHRLCERPFDLLWIVGAHWLRRLPAKMPGRVIIDLVDLEHRKLAWKLRSLQVHPRTPIDCLEYIKWRRLEKALPKLGFELAVCSETDRQALGGGPSVHVVPNGVNLPPFEGTLPAYSSKRPTILFVGTMCYLPNIDGAGFFVRRVLPLIRRDIPEARLFIVGHEPPPEVLQLADGDSVTVTGAVPDVAPYYQQSTIVVAPIRYGGGTRIKILEAMAYRRAVVSTSVGAEGLEVECGRHLLMADRPRAFAAACVQLLKEHDLRERIGTEGFELVKRKYQWSVIDQHVQEIVLESELQRQTGRPLTAP